MAAGYGEAVGITIRSPMQEVADGEFKQRPVWALRGAHGAMLFFHDFAGCGHDVRY